MPVWVSKGKRERERAYHYGWRFCRWLTGTARYVLFSIGNVKPMFQAAFPACWKKNDICNPTWIAAIDYLEICGIIVGQILVGILGDW